MPIFYVCTQYSSNQFIDVYNIRTYLRTFSNGFHNLLTVPKHFNCMSENPHVAGFSDISVLHILNNTIDS